MGEIWTRCWRNAFGKEREIQEIGITNCRKESEPEVRVTLAKLIEEQEAERQQEIKDWIQAQAKEKEKEDEEPEEGQAEDLEAGAEE